MIGESEPDFGNGMESMECQDPAYPFEKLRVGDALIGGRFTWKNSWRSCAVDAYVVKKIISLRM